MFWTIIGGAIILLGVIGVAWLALKLLKWAFPEFTAKLMSWIEDKLHKFKIFDLINTKKELEKGARDIEDALTDSGTPTINRAELRKKLSSINESKEVVTKLLQEGAHLIVIKEDRNGNTISTEKIAIDDPRAQELLQKNVTGSRALTVIPIEG